MAMPWSRAKAIAADYRSGKRDMKQLTALFDACFRIQREASEAAGHHIPLVVENVRGAIPWVGRSRWNFGSFHLWGDVPALMPMVKARAGAGTKTTGHVNKRDGHGHTRHLPNQAETGHLEGIKQGGISGPRANGKGDAVKNGGDWFNAAEPSAQRRHGSKSNARKAASAMIAKIPLVLSRHIAKVYHP